MRSARPLTSTACRTVVVWASRWPNSTTTGEDDEVLVVLASGKVVRSAVAEVPAKGRDTMGVVFARFAESDKIIALAKNTERDLESSLPAEDAEAVGKDETVDEQ